jgi:hypothetical protein
MSDDWKVEKVSYEFGIASFLRRQCLDGQNCSFPRGSSLSAQTYSSLADVQKFITLKLFILSRHANNFWK